MKKNNIDNLFTSGLKDFSPSPKPEVWGNISQQMAAKKQQRKKIIIFFSSAAAAVILALWAISIPQLWQEKTDINREQVAKNKSEITGNKIAATATKINEISGNEIIEKPIAENKLNQQLNKNIELQQHKGKQNNGASYANQQSTTQIGQNPYQFAAINQQQQKATLNKVAVTATLLSIFREIKNNFYLPQTIYHGNDVNEQRLIAYNQSIQQPTSTFQKKWALIGQVATAYSSEKSFHKQGIVNVGGGIKVNLKVSKKLALQTGISFNRYGQSFEKNKMYFENSNGKFEGQIVNISNLATNAGFISNGKTNRGISADVGGTFDAINSIHNDVSQHFDYLELPLLLRYNITDNQFGIFVVGGLGFNYLIGNGVYSVYNNKKIGEISSLKHTNVTSQLAVGIEYRLSKQLKIGIEPTIKYHISSLNKNKAFVYKPYSIGLQTGIRFDF